eukprot:gene1403-2698_t
MLTVDKHKATTYVTLMTRKLVASGAKLYSPKPEAEIAGDIDWIIDGIDRDAVYV